MFYPAYISMKVAYLLLLPLLTIMLAYANLAVIVRKVTKKISTIESVQSITFTHSRQTVYTIGEEHGRGGGMRLRAGALVSILYFVICSIYTAYELFTLLIIVHNIRPPCVA